MPNIRDLLEKYYSKTAPVSLRDETQINWAMRAVSFVKTHIVSAI
jgi:hypothetical protein